MRAITFPRQSDGTYVNHETGIKVERYGQGWRAFRPAIGVSTGELGICRETSFQRALAEAKRYVADVALPAIAEAYDESIAESMERYAAAIRDRMGCTAVDFTGSHVYECRPDEVEAAKAGNDGYDEWERCGQPEDGEAHISVDDAHAEAMRQTIAVAYGEAAAEDGEREAAKAPRYIVKPLTSRRAKDQAAYILDSQTGDVAEAVTGCAAIARAEARAAEMNQPNAPVIAVLARAKQMSQFFARHMYYGFRTPDARRQLIEVDHAEALGIYAAERPRDYARHVIALHGRATGEVECVADAVAQFNGKPVVMEFKQTPAHVDTRSQIEAYIAGETDTLDLPVLNPAALLVDIPDEALAMNAGFDMARRMPTADDLAFAANVRKVPVSQHEVKVGQVWADNDKRSAGRHVLVVEILPAIPAEPHRLAVPARAKVVLCTADGTVIRVNGKDTRTKIRLDRFRPTSTGYRLVRDVYGGAAL